MIWLLIYVLAVSLYDLHTRRIQNWVTLPLILAGLVAHLPGHADIWFTSIGLYLAWSLGWMGAGDAKLWIALLWALPGDVSTQVLPLMFLIFFFTGLMQIIFRWLRKQPSTYLLTPGAWRTILFILLCWYVH